MRGLRPRSVRLAPSRRTLASSDLLYPLPSALCPLISSVAFAAGRFTRSSAMDFVHYLQIALLALIQGAAELLPVSSSAHVIVAQRVMGMDPSRPEQVFLLVMLHTGTMFAVLVYFWPRWRRLWQSSAAGPEAIAAGGAMLRGEIVKTDRRGDGGDRRRGTGPQGLDRARRAGRAAQISQRRSGRAVQAFAFDCGGAGGGRRVDSGDGGPRSRGIGGPMTGRAALWIGLVQGLCVPFRGFSRSGATISTGLFCGVGRGLCEDFSFALALILTPPVQVYSLSKLLAAHALSRSLLVETLAAGARRHGIELCGGALGAADFCLPCSSGVDGSILASIAWWRPPQFAESISCCRRHESRFRLGVGRKAAAGSCRSLATERGNHHIGEGSDFCTHRAGKFRVLE